MSWKTHPLNRGRKFIVFKLEIKLKKKNNNLPIIGANRHELPIPGNSLGPGIS